jgi:hypothetical protein
MKKTFLSLFLLVHTITFAQITISFPVNRAVFQRNFSNTGMIPIAGTFQTRVERIDARLTPIKGGNAIDWVTISVNPNFGTFIGGVFAQAGWYKLEVRALLGKTLVGTSTIEKVGVGEVLIISGQSNAQGYESRGNPPANDDRVNCITNFFSYGQTTEPPFPIIAQITENVKIAPFGNGSWCWGKLGDLLAEKLNVPILFINTGFEAMGIEAWSKSADGERGQDFYSGNFALPGYPYENLKKSLHYYVNMFGARSVLWQQGETDNDKRTSTEKYRQNLEHLISRSRGDTGKNISWMISRSSRVISGTYQPVIDAQNQVIQNYSNTFEGPNTDLITERTDGVHFFGNGLVELARAWNAKLDLNFFSKANSILPSSPLIFDLNCNTDNLQKPVRIFMPNGFKEYYWTNGFSDLSNTASLETSPGIFRGRAIDYLGNVYYTPLVNYSSLSITNQPSIQVEGATSFCEGGSVKLTSNLEQDIFWSTGASSKSIIVSQNGIYTVSQVNYLGCFARSNGITVDVLPKPDVKIVAEGETTFCADKSVRLKANYDNNLIWNNGENNTIINVNKTGEYFARAKNEFGCEGVSQSINVRVLPKPETPFITPDGPTLICADKSVKLTSNISNGITWNTGDKLASLLISKTGEYSVMARNDFGCQSISNIIPIKVNPLPPKPTITTSGPTIFCDGDNVKLTAPESQGYLWSNAKSTRDLTINSSGFFTVKTIDQNGCTSPNSDELEVIVKPSPIGVNILQSGTFTLETTASGLFDVKYEWYKNNVLLQNTNSMIKVKVDGVYTVKGSILHQLGVGRILRCFSPLSSEYEFKIEPSVQGFSVFPNPAPNSIINIETLEELKDAVVNIYNLKGTLIKSYDVPYFDVRRTFDLSETHKGSFLINVKAKDFNVIKRVYIE